MKKLIYLAVLITSLSAAGASTPVEISEKVLKAFKETFSEATNVSWQELDNSCQANFTLSEVQVRAVYDNDGNLLNTVRYYGEKYLPANILAKIKKKFSGKDIFGVTEISAENSLNYYITLKDDKNWYKVKSDPYANVEQTEKFKRADVE